MAGTFGNEKQMQMNIKKQLYDSKDPIEKVRLQCLQRGVSGIKGFARAFKIMDDDSDLQLTMSEFEKGIKDFGIYLDKADVAKIFELFDRDNNGFIHFDEFLIAIRPKLSKSRVAIIQTAFKKLDKSGDGIVTIDDLRGVYNVRHHPDYKNGQKTEDEIFKMFLDNFDSAINKDGKIEYDEFENYYECVSASVDSDGYFDLMMRNAWKL